MGFIEYYDNKIADMPVLPHCVFIESVMGCNLKCKMCPVPGHFETMNKRKFTLLSLDLFKVIIDQVSVEPRMIYLNILGEPLLNKHIVDFVSLAKSLGHKVSFTTNGTLMTSKIAERLLVAGLDEIFFSIDGATKETYERIRVGAKFETVIENISNFYAIKTKNNYLCKVVINCVVSDLTRPELVEMPKVYKNICDEIKFSPLFDFSKDYAMPEEFGKTEPLTLKSKGRYPCTYLWSGLYISAEGNVVYCCNDHQYGDDRINVMDMPLIDIWKQSIGSERRNHVLNSYKSDPCKSCDVWKSNDPPRPFYNPRKFLAKLKKKLKAVFRA